MPGFPPEVHKGRERMTTTTVENIKKIEGECTKLVRRMRRCGKS
jgi:hypothetical protein